MPVVPASPSRPRPNWPRWITVAAACLFLLASADEAAANCAGGATTRTVSSGENLASIMATSTAPCTLTVNPGTYDAPAAQGHFQILDGITVRAPNGATLRVPGGTFAVVAVWPLGAGCPSGATLEGFTLSGGVWGAYVGGHPGGAPGCAVTGVTLRNLAVQTTTGGHGIHFKGVQNSVIDSCTISSAFVNGIFLETGGGNLVMNNTVLNTANQHAIAVQGSSDNVVVGNTISGAKLEGILVTADPSGARSWRNRIERNAISGYGIDGITLLEGSSSNYVGLNTAVSTAYHPLTKPNPDPISGTGIWVNGGSNANYLFGNDVSGAPENGIDVLAASSTLIQGNSIHGNNHGGLWIANVQFATDANVPVPQDTVIQGNNIFFNTHNQQVILQGAVNVEVAYNYLSGARAGALAGPNTGGISINEGGDAARGVVGSSGVSVFENTVTDVSNRAYVYATTTNTVFFRNRFLNGAAGAGREGVTYSFPPGGIQWNAGALLGGNHWNEFGAASGNPDPAHPYNNFIGNAGGGPYVDWLPYQSEGLLTSYARYKVDTIEPIGGSVLAAGTKKTIRWVARGCVLVDLYYGSPAGSAVIAARYPNVGHYFWTVPAAPFRQDYSVQVVCLNANGVPVGAAGTSRPFSIATGDLVLLNPGRAFRAWDGGTVRVAWKKTASVAAVNIFIKAGSGAETLVASNVSGTFRDIALPAAVWGSSEVTIRVQDAANAGRQDSVDGYFQVRGATPAFRMTSVPSSVVVGSIHVLDWVGTATSFTVDLDLYQNNVPVRSIARNLPDFGSYTWFVPEILSANSRIHATFKDASGVVRGQADTGTFRILSRNTVTGDFDGDGRVDLAVYRPSGGGWFINPSAQNFNPASSSSFQWGLSTDIPLRADFDGDGRSDLVVYRPSDGGWYIRYSSLGYAQSQWAYFQWGLPTDIPVPGDFDGDARTDLAVYRPSDGGWYIRYSSVGWALNQWAYFQWGLPTDTPLATDFDGDGRTDLAVYRPSDGGWYIRYSSLGYAQSQWAYFQWGLSTDKPQVADFDGDGRTDLVVYRPSDGGWYIRYSSAAYALPQWAYFQWGLSTDAPVPADFDGDGRTDLVVFRSADGGWYIRYSSLGYALNQWAYYQWGLPTDVPLRR